MVLAPSLGLKKVRYNMQRCYVCCNGLFLYYILEKSGGVYGNRNYRR